MYVYIYMYTPARVLFYNYTPSNIETPWFEMLDAGNDGWHVETRPRRPSRRWSQRKTTCQGYSVGCVPKEDGRWRICLKNIKHCYTYLYWDFFRYDIIILPRNDKFTKLDISSIYIYTCENVPKHPTSLGFDCWPIRYVSFKRSTIFQLARASPGDNIHLIHRIPSLSLPGRKWWCTWPTTPSTKRIRISRRAHTGHHRSSQVNVHVFLWMCRST